MVDDREGSASPRALFEVSSRLAAPPAEVWAAVRTIEGVNRELWPFVRMTCPFRGMTLDSPEVPIGARAFRSYLLLFCVLPVEYDDVTLSRIEPGRGFLETSSMLSLKVWQHEREVLPSDNGRGSILIDRIGFEPRSAARPFVRIIAAVSAALFRWRHRRLRSIFGSAAITASF